MGPRIERLPVSRLDADSDRGHIGGASGIGFAEQSPDCGPACAEKSRSPLNLQGTRADRPPTCINASRRPICAGFHSSDAQKQVIWPGLKQPTRTNRPTTCTAASWGPICAAPMQDGRRFA